MLNKSQITAYLQRIGISGEISLDLVGLNTLIRAQLTHIPFEALDVWGAGACPSLKIDDLFRKIVVDCRGGYCFELNTLFRALLNSLGFDAHQAIASLVDEEGVVAPPAHNVIICTIDGVAYFVDVGFGGNVPFGAMVLNKVPQLGFHLIPNGDFWYVQRVTTAGEVNMLRFRNIPAEPCELIPLNFYISQLPDVHFRHILRVNLRKADGRIFSLVDHELTIRQGDQTDIFPVAGKEQLTQVLKACFGIDAAKIDIRKEY